MHPADYFAQVNKLAFHDLTENGELPIAANQLLGLGLKYIPTPRINITQEDVDRSLTRFERDMGLRVFFSGDDNDDNSYDPSTLRSSSKWRAPLPPREIDNRICNFQHEIERILVKRRTTPNLSPLQEKILHTIRRNKNIVILSADKGLGPVGVSTKQYVEWGLKHLTDNSTYTILHEEQADQIANDLYQKIFQWTRTHRRALEDDTTKYIRDHIEKARQKDPFGYFYMLAKLHKTPISTRPVCSDCASLPHSVGKWVDRQLQPIVQKQRTYFKNSFELKHLLENMDPLPPNACLFTYDAVSMYTNIDTAQCMQRLTSFITNPATIEQYPHLRPNALVEALDIVMHNNRMHFGNLLVHQHKGIAMGMAPAPSIANLFVAIYEEAHMTSVPKSTLPFLRRFIDDGFGIWLRDADIDNDTNSWESFQALVNNMGLQWEFSGRSDRATFMDLNIQLVNGKLYTSLYAKPMALHLYIPPTSCHAPGIATGLIHGHIYRLFMLCSHESDIEQEIYLFLNRLLDRGYSLPTLIPIFLTAEQKARQHQARQLLQQTNPQTCSTLENTNRRATNPTDGQEVFFHLRYHPSNPSAKDIQKIW